MISLALCLVREKSCWTSARLRKCCWKLNLTVGAESSRCMHACKHMQIWLGRAALVVRDHTRHNLRVVNHERARVIYLLHKYQALPSVSERRSSGVQTCLRSVGRSFMSHTIGQLSSASVELSMSAAILALVAVARVAVASGPAGAGQGEGQARG